MPTHYDPALRYDLSHELKNPPRKPNGKRMTEVGRDGKTLMRDPKKIISLGLHQTAADFTVVKYQIQAAGGDWKLALARRCINVPAHAFALTEGFFVTGLPLLAHAYCGHGLNDHALQVEIDGKYCGRTADREGSTWGGKPMAVTPLLLETARNAVGFLYEEGMRLGCDLQYYEGHRQYTNKPSDPGEELWVGVGIDFCEKELGLKPRLDYFETDRKGLKGRPICRDWDPRSPHKY